MTLYAAISADGNPMVHPMLGHVYAGASEREVLSAVLHRAKMEGFKGTVQQRMKELGWTVQRVYTQADMAKAFDEGWECKAQGKFDNPYEVPK